jgi:hypothetical protein
VIFYSCWVEARSKGIVALVVSVAEFFYVKSDMMGDEDEWMCKRAIALLAAGLGQFFGDRRGQGSRQVTGTQSGRGWCQQRRF